MRPDFFIVRRPRRVRPAKQRAAAAAAASSATLAICAFVLAILPPLAGTGVSYAATGLTIVTVAA